MFRLIASGVIVLMLIAVVSIHLWVQSLIQDDIDKFNDAILRQVQYEVIDNLESPTTVLFNNTKSFVIATSNPELWLATVSFTAENNMGDRVSRDVSCRVRKVNDSLVADACNFLEV